MYPDEPDEYWDDHPDDHPNIHLKRTDYGYVYDRSNYCYTCQICEIGIFVHGNNIHELEQELQKIFDCQESCRYCNEEWSNSKVEIGEINKQKLEKKLQEEQEREKLHSAYNEISDDNFRYIPRSIIRGQDLSPEEISKYYSRRVRRVSRDSHIPSLASLDENEDTNQEYAFHVRRPGKK